jgi:predicted DsbA family dithiol-disulfide isomerase
VLQVKILIFIIIASSLSIIAPVCPAEGDNGITMDLFVMSMCPYGTQAQNIIIPIVKDLKDKIHLNIFFIATENTKNKTPVENKNEADNKRPVSQPQELCINSAQQSSGKFSSLHGQKEVTEDIRQLVIIKYFKEKYYDYLAIRNQNIESSDPVVIMKSVGIDSDYVENIVKAEEGEKILSENIKEAQKRNINASPTIFINGQVINDNITSNRINRNLCKYISLSTCNDLPICGSDNDCAARNDMITACINPESKESQCIYGTNIPVKITVINDPNIPVLNPEVLLNMLRNDFPAAVFTSLDYRSDDGKELLKEYSPDFLPTIILEAKIEDSIRFPKIAQLIRKNGDAYIFKAEFLPNRFYFKRPQKSNALELFVNSISENANRLENILLADNRYSFTINYNASLIKKKNDNQLVISQKDEGGYDLSKTEYLYDIRSNFGKDDLYEDIRQLCISKYNPELINSYLRCFTNEFSRQASTNRCLEFILMDNKKISNCIKDSDGIEMLAKNAAYGNSIGIGSDAAVLLHNQILLQEFDFNTIYEILEKSDL